jgi:hypothetical protein
MDCNNPIYEDLKMDKIIKIINFNYALNANSVPDIGNICSILKKKVMALDRSLFKVTHL